MSCQIYQNWSWSTGSRAENCTMLTFPLQLRIVPTCTASDTTLLRVLIFGFSTSRHIQTSPHPLESFYYFGLGSLTLSQHNPLPPEKKIKWGSPFLLKDVTSYFLRFVAVPLLLSILVICKGTSVTSMHYQSRTIVFGWSTVENDVASTHVDIQVLVHSNYLWRWCRLTPTRTPISIPRNNVAAKVIAQRKKSFLSTRHRILASS